MQNEDRNVDDGNLIATQMKSMAIIDASPVPMAINDEQQRITYLNPAFVQTFGYSRGDIPTLAEWWPQAYPSAEYRQWVAAAWQSNLDRAKRSGVSFSPLEVKVRCKNGEDKTVLASAASLADTFRGEHLVILCDITERKLAEERLAATEKRLATVFSSCPVGMCITTMKDGTLLELNDVCCEMSRCRREDVLGRTATELGYWLRPDDRDKLVKEIREKGSLKGDEFAFRHQDGTIGYALRSIERLTFDEQDCILSMFIDITERKQIDEELRASRQRLEVLSRQLMTTQETERRHLARELHDDIGQILTAIKLNLRRTQRAADANLQLHLEENIDLVDQAIGQVRHLALSLRPPQLDELGLVAALHGLLKHQARLGGFEEQLDIAIVDLQIPPDLETVCFRIAQEALTNAVRHGKPSHVQIRLWTSEDQLQLLISDNGIGFDVAESRHRALEGNSIGVISMQERASLAGGRIAIESTPGCGTKIHVRFPLRDATQVKS